jgi:hypothetical protein
VKSNLKGEYSILKRKEPIEGVKNLFTGRHAHFGQFVKMAPKRNKPSDPIEAKRKKAEYDRERRAHMSEEEKLRRAAAKRGNREKMSDQERSNDSQRRAEDRAYQV